MRKPVSSFALICIFIFSSFAQEARTEKPPAQATDESLANSVDRVFAEWDKPDSPGCALAVLKDGKIIYERGYGMASLENRIPITPRSVFDIASTSKQFTAMAILLLAQRGKLSLDDEVRKYVPELPDFHEPITIRQLVYHTNGLRDLYYLLELAGWRYDDEIREEDALALVARMKELNHPPGAEHSYNNTGYWLLSLIVKRAGGQSLREFAEANIFKPLGMSDTQFRDDHNLVLKNRTEAYAPVTGGGFELSLGAVNTVGPNGVFTTVEDLARWDQNFYDKRVGGETVIRQMLTPGELSDGTKFNYAFGLRLEDYKGLRMVWHSGAGAGTRTTYLRFPDQHFSVILFCNLNSMDMDSLARRVADIFLTGQFKEPRDIEEIVTPRPVKPAAVSARELANVTGLYFDSNLGLTRRLYVRDGKLFYFRSAGNESELSPLGENRFLMLGVPGRTEVAFRLAQKDAKRQMLLMTGGGKPNVFELVEPASKTAAQLAELAGDYKSEELDATYTIVVRQGSLILRRKKWSDIELTALFTDAFKDDYLGTVVFTRDPQRHVNGFTLSNGLRGVRRLRFSKQPS